MRDLLRSLRDRGVRLSVDGDRLVVRGRAGALTSELTERMRQHKSELVRILRDLDTGHVPGSATSLAGMADPDAPQLSLAQRRYWHLQRLAPDSTIYNGPGAFRLRGPLDRAALCAALQGIVDRHDVLRSQFSERGGEAILSIAPEAHVELDVTDLQGTPESERDAALRAFLEQAVDEPFDLARAPLLRVRLVELGPEDHALFVLSHSTVWDGWSFDLLLRELKVHYETAIEGGTGGLPPLPIQYTDFAAWQAQRLARGELDEHLAYWRRRLAGPIPSLALPTDRPRRIDADFAGARVGFRIEGEVVAAVRELARSQGATPYMVVLAVLNVLFHRYSGVRDVLIASPLQGRAHPELEDLIGVFANTLFFRNRIDPDQSFSSLLHDVRDTCLEAVEHQECPSELVVEALEGGALGRTPYEVVFVYQQAAARPTMMGPVSVRSIHRGTRHVAVDLQVWTREYDDYFDGGFDYRTSLFDADRIERMAGHYLRLLESAARDPDTPVGDLALLTEEEIRQLDAWERPAGVHVVEAVPHAAGGGNLTCGTLSLEGPALDQARAWVRDRVLGAAGSIRADGTGGGIALLLEGSAEAALALEVLAAQSTETLLVPPDVPGAMLEALIGEAGVTMVIGGPGGPPVDTQVAPAVVELDLSQRMSVEASDSGAAPPTGGVLLPVPRPGGGVLLVERSWESVLADAHVVQHELGLGPERRVAVFADGSADQIAATALAAMRAGARLVLPEPGLPPDGWDLDELVRGEGVDVIVAGSWALQQLVDTGWETRVDVVLSGDPFVSPELLVALTDRAGTVKLGWGMSEVGGWSLIADVADEDRVILGRPTEGLRTRVVDERGRPVPQGVPGELWITGDRVAGGYRKAPEAAARRFVMLPNQPEKPTFRTGNRVFWDGEGRLVDAGRVDREEILNGHRIDLAAIATILQDLPAVAEAHVGVERIEGERRLVAYVVPRADETVVVDEIRRSLGASLHRAAVPEAIVPVTELPRTPSGAVDGERLRKLAESAARGIAHVEPRDERERAVATVWCEVLGIEQVGVHDNFFQLGGHSLLALQSAIKLEERAGLRIDPRTLFFNTLDQIAGGATDVTADPTSNVTS